jgi:hypothetical protein
MAPKILIMIMDHQTDSLNNFDAEMWPTIPFIGNKPFTIGSVVAEILTFKSLLTCYYKT